MDASSAFKDTLPTTPEALFEILQNAGITFTRHEHPPLRTVEESKGHRGDMVGTHVKNLYLRDRKKRNFLVVAQEDREIDLKGLQDKIGADRLSFGSADRLFEFLGVITIVREIGGFMRILVDSEEFEFQTMDVFADRFLPIRGTQ